jgi:hypothetical protein
MHRVGFEPKTRVFELAKAVHAFDRTATVITLSFPTDFNKEQQSPPYEVNNHSPSDEISRLSCNPNYSVHKNPPLGPIPSQMTSFHNLTPIYYSQILILSSH